MAHARTTIRSEIVTALTGLTTTGANVFDSYVYALDATQLPALVVTTPEEELFEGSSLDDDQMRQLTVLIEIRVRALTPAATVDTIDTEVAVALYGATITGAKQVDWRAIEITNDATEEQPIFLAVVRYEVLYNVDATNPATANA